MGSSAYYLANKLNTELAGTGVNVTANTKVLLGPFDDGVSGAVTFDLKGKNADAVSINSSIDSSDISALAKRINEYSSQTGLIATVTSDFKKIIIESKDGYDINLKNITAHFHDWGGPVGFRVLAEEPNRFDRVIATNTSLPATGRGLSLIHI